MNLAGFASLDFLSPQKLFATTDYAATFADKNPLRERAARSGLIYGAASGWEYLHDKKFAIAFAQECGILVPESELKWAAIRPSANSFNFSGADWLLEFARSKNMLFRGHTLVWHDALPAWFRSTVRSENAASTLQSHIATVAGRYAGKMHSWDVVNEAVFPPDNQANGLRNSPWLKLLGPNYIDMAFRETAKADPSALLVLNQDRLEYDSALGDQCRKATLALLQRLVSSGVPVHALGIESHLGLSAGHFNAKKFKVFLSEVDKLGLKILITELDAVDDHFLSNQRIRDLMVQRKYDEFLSVVVQEPSVIAVLTWGLSDKYTWLETERPRADKALVRPLPLDRNGNRKLVWGSLAQAFDDRAKLGFNQNPGLPIK